MSVFAPIVGYYLTLIACENDERAIQPAHVGERIGFSVGALEREVVRLRVGMTAVAIAQQLA
jgi:hypothetical protein